MAFITTIITKSTDEEPWIRFNSPEEAAAFFTAEEVQNIVIPYNNQLNSLPGYIGSSIVDITNRTMKIVREFDTLENANLAKAYLSNIDQASITGKYLKLFRDKRAELGLKYTYSVSITE